MTRRDTRSESESAERREGDAYYAVCRVCDVGNARSQFRKRVDWSRPECRGCLDKRGAREYRWAGEKRSSYLFQRIQVSTADPTPYVLGAAMGRE